MNTFFNFTYLITNISCCPAIQSSCSLALNENDYIPTDKPTSIKSANLALFIS